MMVYWCRIPYEWFYYFILILASGIPLQKTFLCFTLRVSETLVHCSATPYWWQRYIYIYIYLTVSFYLHCSVAQHYSFRIKNCKYMRFRVMYVYNYLTANSNRTKHLMGTGIKISNGDCHVLNSDFKNVEL